MRVPAYNLVGEENQGFYQAMRFFDYNRAIVALQSLGAAQECIDETITYVKGRHTFGRPLAKYEGISFQLAEFITMTEAARLLCYQALSKKAEGSLAARRPPWPNGLARRPLPGYPRLSPASRPLRLQQGPPFRAAPARRDGGRDCRWRHISAKQARAAAAIVVVLAPEWAGHFAHDAAEGDWKSTRGGDSLQPLLERELSGAAGQTIVLDPWPVTQ